jgi:predicted AAA+ superfamily ATPase
MLFISGPRQSGKTTFAKMLLDKLSQGIYTNWDIINDQKKIIHTPYFFENENRDLKEKYLVIFDEIHKYKNWKNYLKGCFDKYNAEYSFVITGSGRLDLFKKGGDSLFGRYFAINLFPFSLSEIELKHAPSFENLQQCLLEGFDVKQAKQTYDQLFHFSGFPEPLLKSDTSFYNIWSNQRKMTLIKEDIRDAYFIKDISNIEILANILPYKVGSLLSLNSIREDMNVAFESVKKWLSILEQFYYFFSIKPYTKSIQRAIKKEKKIYLYDWVEIESEPIRFENMIAFHLFKAINLWSGFGYGKFDLFYIRDKDSKEVDFLITKDTQPLFMVEAKFDDENISKNLIAFQQKTKTPFLIQVINKTGVLKKKTYDGYIQYLISADNFLLHI